MKRNASAHWQGDGKTGSGQLSLQSGVLAQQPYSFNTRFVSADGKAGTNPEELIAAAHAGCFSMALAFALSAQGHVPLALDTRASVELALVDGHFEIVAIQLDLSAQVPGLDAAQFDALAQTAKANCPVSKALAAVPISLNAQLV
ncbi:MAG: OsmC family protein [Lysobacterales bacterium]|mgnify:CR=1 FL=1